MEQSAMGGLEYLLTQEIRAAKYDKSWSAPHYALDNESLHHILLTIMLTQSSSFCKQLLSADGTLDRHSPEFDLWMKLADGRTACIEVKVWNPWKNTQLENQRAVLNLLEGSQGFILMLGNSSQMTREQVKDKSEGTFTKLSYSDLGRALSAVNESPTLIEIAATYKEALDQQETRIRSQYSKFEPNA